MNNSPIGVFDSGLGGLSVWRMIVRMLPEESVVFYGDGKNCPYGPKTQNQIQDYAKDAVDTLLAHDAKLVVVACNTATAAAIKFLRTNYNVPIVGMEPAVKPAALATKTGVIGILATQGSLNGELYKHTAAQFANNVKILSHIGEGFVELVETGNTETPEAIAIVRQSLEPLIAQNADQIVLGCTHYPFLDKAIKAVIGTRKVEIIDPSPAVARRTTALLDEFALRAEQGHKPYYEFLSAAGEDYVQKIKSMASRISGLTFSE